MSNRFFIFTANGDCLGELNQLDHFRQWYTKNRTWVEEVYPLGRFGLINFDTKEHCIIEVTPPTGFSLTQY